MTIDIHFSGNTLAELQDAMRSFLSEGEPVFHVFDTCAKHLETLPTVTLEEPEAPATTEAPVTTAVASKEETLEALHKLRREKGSDAVKALLNRHGASSFPTLDPGEYAKVLEEARQ